MRIQIYLKDEDLKIIDAHCLSVGGKRSTVIASLIRKHLSSSLSQTYVPTRSRFQHFGQMSPALKDFLENAPEPPRIPAAQPQPASENRRIVSDEAI